jgi:hypothetical protein
MNSDKLVNPPGTITCTPRGRESTTIVDLRTPSNFEQESYKGQAPKGIEHKGKFRTRSRISVIDSVHP